MKPAYTVKFRHDEKSLFALSHMQYDLFCQKNYVARTAIAAVAIIIAMNFMDRWWAYLLIAYGGFLLTGKYNSSNHTAKQIIANIKASGMPFPGSVFEFNSTDFSVIPDPKQSDDDVVTLSYKKILKLGEDVNYFYIFKDEFGGYCIAKEALGDGRDAFRSFLQGKTGLKFIRRASVFNSIREYLSRKEREPYHL